MSFARKQAFGAWLDRRHRPLQDDIASTAYRRQAEPHAPFPELPGLNGLEAV